MESSTVRPLKSRDCWYVRARPSFARWRAGRLVTSSPKSSTVPDDAGRSPQMTLNSVVLPAPFGPRIARRSPWTTSRSTPSTARSPPKRRPTPRKRRAGSAFSTDGAASVTDLLDDLVRDDAVLDDLDLPLPRQLPLHARREVATRRGLARREEPAERLIDVRHVAGQRCRRLAVLALHDLQRILVLDRLTTAVEIEHAVVGHLEG